MKYLLALLMCLFSSNVMASSDTSHSGKVKYKETQEALKFDKGAKHVEVFTVIDRIYNIDISAGTFMIEAEILLKWRNASDLQNLKKQFSEHTITGHKLDKALDKLWHPEFVVKSETVRRETLFRTLHLNPDGSLELFEKFETTLPVNTEIRQYPFGTLKLNLDIVAFTHDAKEMTFDPVYFEIGHKEQEEPVLVGNWKLLDSFVDKKISHRLSSTDQIYSQNGFHFIIEHEFLDSLQKIFFPIGCIILISLFLNLFSSMRFKDNISIRIYGQLYLLLTFFALKFTLADEIPTTHYINLVDLLFIIGTAVIVLNLFSSIILSERYLEEKAGTRRLEIILDKSAPALTFVALFASFIYVFS